jgi:hypothetical protein
MSANDLSYFRVINLKSKPKQELRNSAERAKPRDHALVQIDERQIDGL